MERSRLAEIAERNPKIDRTAIDRSERAVRDSADTVCRIPVGLR